MNGPVLGFFLVALASIGMLSVLGVGLFRSAMRLVRAVGVFTDEATPLVDDITAGLDAASRHAGRLTVAASSLRSAD